MGFYHPAQIVMDARKHEVEVRAVDINYSNWDNLLEETSPVPTQGQDTPSRGGRALRLGFRQIKGLRQEDMNLLMLKRKEGFKNIPELFNAGLSKVTLKKLADADAFRSIGLDRRKALWEVAAINDQPTGIFSGQTTVEEKVSLPEMTTAQHVVQDYAALSLSIKAHPVSFVREKLQQLHIVSCIELNALNDGDPVKVAGLVLVRQRPGTAKGVCFITIEDETGVANLVVFPNLFEQYRKAIVQSRLLMVEGKLQREGDVIHVIAEGCYDLSRLLRLLTVAKKVRAPLFDENEKVFSEGRNFK
jgi:error-prone DNA polymerase